MFIIYRDNLFLIFTTILRFTQAVFFYLSRIYIRVEIKEKLRNVDGLHQFGLWGSWQTVGALSINAKQVPYLKFEEK